MTEKPDEHCRVPNSLPTLGSDHFLASLFVARHVCGGAVPKLWFNAPDGAVLRMLYYLTKVGRYAYIMGSASGYPTTLDRQGERVHEIRCGRCQWLYLPYVR